MAARYLAAIAHPAANSRAGVDRRSESDWAQGPAERTGRESRPFGPGRRESCMQFKRCGTRVAESLRYAGWCSILKPGHGWSRHSAPRRRAERVNRGLWVRVTRVRQILSQRRTLSMSVIFRLPITRADAPAASPCFDEPSSHDCILLLSPCSVLVGRSGTAEAQAWIRKYRRAPEHPRP